MNKQTEIQTISKYVMEWLSEIDSQNALNFFDINKLSEDLCKDVLNTIFDLRLENLNQKQANFPAIDLGDNTQGKVAFQITSRTDGTKIRDTLEAFVKYQHDKTFTNGLRFLILKLDRPRMKKSKYQWFDPKKHILSAKDLLHKIVNLYNTDYPKFSRIKDIFAHEYGGKLDNKQRQDPTSGEIRDAIRKYWNRGPRAWEQDPILETPGQPYCPLHLTEQRLSPLEVACDSPYAIITGDVGSGKTSLMIHVVRELLYLQQNPTHWPLPVSFAAIKDFDTNDGPPFTILRSALWPEFETLQYCWNKGSLWLYLDEIDPAEEKYRLLPAWLRRLRDENEREGRANRVWLSLRSKDFREHGGELKNWREMSICPPSIPEVWQYLRAQRSLLREKWGSLYNFWVSPSSPLPKDSLFGLNLLLNYYQSAAEGGSDIDYLRELSHGFLKQVLPSGLRRNEKIKEVDLLIIRPFARQWLNSPPETWKDWNGKIDAESFEAERREFPFPELGPVVLKDILQRDFSTVTISFPFMLNYWVVEAALTIWSGNRAQISGGVAALSENPNFWSLAILFLERLSDSRDWDLVVSKCFERFRNIRSSDQASIAIKFLWRVSAQSNANQQTWDQLIHMMKTYPELREESTREREMTLDDLALGNQEIPPALCDLLSDHLIRRHQSLRELFHSNGAEKLRSDLYGNSPRLWEEWLSIIEQYPIENAAEQAVKACFEYRNSLDTATINRILSAFSFFCLEPNQRDIIQTWMNDILEAPERLYVRDPQRTIALLYALRGWSQFASLTFIQKLCELGEDRRDNNLKEVALDLMQSTSLTEAASWLTTFYDKEVAPLVKDRILQHLIACGEISKLEDIVATGKVPLLRLRAAIALLTRYHQGGENEKELAILSRLSTIQLLKSLAKMPEVSLTHRDKVANFFLESRTRINLEEAKAVARVSAHIKVLERILTKLPTEQQRTSFRSFMDKLQHTQNAEVNTWQRTSA
ncbi:MAG: SMEK domain-containing protein [Bacteroidetes bacterium]|nr:SMEK domain-containing protein [Bacteroidota bacterium]MCW5896763.1 SMEK domain-containing protein [Bacteroidota bacterium]